MRTSLGIRSTLLVICTSLFLVLPAKLDSQGDAGTPAYRNAQLPVEQRVVEPGMFDIMVGGNSTDLNTVTLEVVAK